MRSVNLATGDAIREYAEYGRDTVEERLWAALAARRSWARAPASERAAALEWMSGVLRGRQAKLARLMALEMGKPIATAEAEVVKRAWGLRSIRTGEVSPVGSGQVSVEEAVMKRAKAFFYVCAGVFLLALSFHLGATSARGQGGGTGWFVEGSYGGSCYVVTASGDWWRYVPGLGWLNDLGNIFGGASGARTIVSLLPGIALTSNGEVWYGGNGGTWTNAGVPPLGPTPSTHESWGQLKAKYR